MKTKKLFTLLAVVIALSSCSSSQTGEKTSSAKVNTQNTQTTSEVKSVPPADMQVKSTFNSITTWNQGQQFLNVIGSTKDPHINSKTWIEVYREKCGFNPGNHSATGAICPKNALGGHVVKNGQSQHPAPNSLVYIVPICTSENNQPNLQMTIAANGTCVVVLNYWMK
ncbi:hypothetical protein DFO53_0577 [Enterobacter sp. AG5470]|nr:hypothetical protein DFO53_0577 [Enterobacter sp. AG5470]